MYRFGSYPGYNAQLSDPGRDYLRSRYPDLPLREARIAYAAELAGFNCVYRPNLHALIDAVKGACETVTYPNRYTGEAFQRSSTYPDTWIAQHGKKRVMQAYKDAERGPPVPAFVVSAKDILKDVTNQARGQQVAGTAGRVGNKRGARDHIDLMSSTSHKRTKTENAYLPSSSGHNQGALGNLTGEPAIHPDRQRWISNPTPDDMAFGRLTPISTTLQPNTTRQQPQAHRKKNKPKPQRRKGDVVHRQSTDLFNRVKQKLYSSTITIDTHRDALRQRWELDTGLQLESVTENLGALNAAFVGVEEALGEAIGIIEDKLIPRGKARV